MSFLHPECSTPRSLKMSLKFSFLLMAVRTRYQSRLSGAPGVALPESPSAKNQGEGHWVENPVSTWGTVRARTT
jgi:hypothetical protein